MLALKGFTKLSAVIGMLACLAPSGAGAADLTRPLQEVCRAGVMTIAQSGAPVLDPNNQTVGCCYLPAADNSQREQVCRDGVLWDPVSGTPLYDPTQKGAQPIACACGPDNLWLAPAALVVGLGACAAAGCFNQHNPPPPIPVFPSSP